MSDIRRRPARSTGTVSGPHDSTTDARSRGPTPNDQQFDADPGTMMFSSWQALLLGTMVTGLLCYWLFFDLVRDELARMEARGETLFSGRKPQIPV